MDNNDIDQDLLRFGEFVSQTMGLHFPPSRYADLRRGLAATTKLLGCDDAADCVQRLIAGPLSMRQLNAMADSLTVGETYFFRDESTFDILAKEVLPPLIRLRSRGDRRLRIWSAACCTGEEPYSIAITLRRMLTDWEGWDITVLGTDINSHFLQRAEKGIFGPWSFRNAPAWLKDGYFRPTADGRFEIAPEIKRMVRFTQLNLNEDAYPSPINGIHTMDVIFCRNVLMYFTPAQAGKVVQRLYRAQVDGGWLITSPSELLHVSQSPYVTAHVAGSVLNHKTSGISPASSEPLPRDVQPQALLPEQTWQFATDVSKPVPEPGHANMPDDDNVTTLKIMAYRHANQDTLSGALASCDRWIAADKFNPAAHYLRAVILQEHGDLDDAVRSLRRTLYLEPQFAIAHVTMAMIARQLGNVNRAHEHLRHALQVLRSCPDTEVLTEIDGMTTGRLTGIVNAMLSNKEAA